MAKVSSICEALCPMTDGCVIIQKPPTGKNIYASEVMTLTASEGARGTRTVSTAVCVAWCGFLCSRVAHAAAQVLKPLSKQPRNLNTLSLAGLTRTFFGDDHERALLLGERVQGRDTRQRILAPERH